MNARNIEEYVAMKVIEHLEKEEKEKQGLQKQIRKLTKQNKQMSKILKDRNICYNCICSRCGKTHVYSDDTHSHNSHPEYSVLCYSCFFAVL